MSWDFVKNRMDVTFRPILRWPAQNTRERESGPFRSSLSDTLVKLEREIRMLDGEHTILEIAIPEGRWRQDGLPRADATATHPGVILSFNSTYGPMRIWFDGFTHWHNNLRAIALHLENLRHASLYGVGQDGQQYRGWLAIESPKDAGFKTIQDAAAFMGVHGEQPASSVLNHRPSRNAAYRTAAAKLHPDVQGGSSEQFVLLQMAKEMLEAATR